MKSVQILKRQPENWENVLKMKIRKIRKNSVMF